MAIGAISNGNRYFYPINSSFVGQSMQPAANIQGFSGFNGLFGGNNYLSSSFQFSPLGTSNPSSTQSFPVQQTGQNSGLTLQALLSNPQIAAYIENLLGITPLATAQTATVSTPAATTTAPASVYSLTTKPDEATPTGALIVSPDSISTSPNSLPPAPSANSQAIAALGLGNPQVYALQQKAAGNYVAPANYDYSGKSYAPPTPITVTSSVSNDPTVFMSPSYGKQLNQGGYETQVNQTNQTLWSSYQLALSNWKLNSAQNPTAAGQPPVPPTYLSFNANQFSSNWDASGANNFQSGPGQLHLDQINNPDMFGSVTPSSTVTVSSTGSNPTAPNTSQQPAAPSAAQVAYTALLNQINADYASGKTADANALANSTQLQQAAAAANKAQASSN